MRCFIFMFVLLLAAVAAADGPILLVTPQGVWQAEVVNGVPGPWTPRQIDVIVQGFGGGGVPNPPKDPPADPADPVVAQVAAASKSLQNAQEATAVAAIIDSLVKTGVAPKDLKEALDLSAGIADSALKANGRIVAWVKTATAITADPAKLKAGLSLAWGIQAATLDVIHTATQQPEGAAISEEALDFAVIIQLIQMILSLLKSLGII